jgi:hypothetical protein
MKKECLRCKQVFETTDGRRKYCSDECAAKSESAKQIESSKKHEERSLKALKKSKGDF